MVLENSSVVVEKRSFRSGHDVEVVGRSCVLEIVNKCSDEGGEYF